MVTSNLLRGIKIYQELGSVWQSLRSCAMFPWNSTLLYKLFDWPSRASTQEVNRCSNTQFTAEYLPELSTNFDYHYTLYLISLPSLFCIFKNTLFMMMRMPGSHSFLNRTAMDGQIYFLIRNIMNRSSSPLAAVELEWECSTSAKSSTRCLLPL